MKKLGIELLVLIMALCLLGCKEEEIDGNNGIVVTTSLEGKEAIVGDIDCIFPLVSESTEMNILVSGYQNVDQNDIYVWDKYEEMTGVTTNFKTYTTSERSKAVTLAFLNNEQLDLILRCKISATRLTRYGETGAIIDLAENDLLKTYAPNCWAYLQSHPDALASVTNPDGSIYAIPQINSGAELRVSRKIYVNKTWLENLDLELPSTTQEFYELLKAFKDNDANGNGDTTDEIPLSSQDWLSIQDAFYGAFGLANRGLHNTTIDYNEETGGVRFIASSDEYKDFLEYFNKLYTEKLLDNYIFSMTSNQWYNNANADLIGVFVSTNLAGLPADKVDNWVAIEEALEGPNGDKMWTAIRANFHSTGAAVIPSTCKNPELVLQWLDYFWTDEGTLFYHMGIEGETFVVNEDGSYDYAPSIYEEMQTSNKTFDDVVALISPYPGGGNPTVEVSPYFMGGEMADVPASAALALFEYGPDEYWPSFTFTNEENALLDAIKSDITKYTDTWYKSFITGSEPFTEWDNYVEQLNKLNVNTLLEIYQAAVDRYEDFKTKLED